MVTLFSADGRSDEFDCRKNSRISTTCQAQNDPTDASWASKNAINHIDSGVVICDNRSFVCLDEGDNGTSPTVLPVLDLRRISSVSATDSGVDVVGAGENGETSPDPCDQPIAANANDKHKNDSEETSCSFFLQVIFPFLIAGAGMVGAGVLLDAVQYWPLFATVPETFVLVPALLGLKGNLEMTLASRLSTLANLGRMETKEQQFKVLYANLALVQVQATCVAFCASAFALGITAIQHKQLNFAQAAMLCATSMTTASLASMLLGLLMAGVVLVARRLHIDPDNVTTPIAASLGDLTTLATLVTFGTIFLTVRDTSPWINVLTICSFFVAAPLWIWLATRDNATVKVLKNGWWPVISAMFISSAGGFILEATVVRFPGIAIFQPVINGVGGNLAAVQASRLSTSLHQTGIMGRLPSGIPMDYISLKRAFFSKDVDSRSARVLLMMVVPGQLLFMLLIYLAKAGNIDLSTWFILAYLFVALVQVFLLLFVCQWLVRQMWRWKIDPDNSAIPYLTALGDLCGTGLLAAAFVLLSAVGGNSP